MSTRQITLAAATLVVVCLLALLAGSLAAKVLVWCFAAKWMLIAILDLPDAPHGHTGGPK